MKRLSTRDKEQLEALLSRRQESDRTVAAQVTEIIEAVRRQGDQALREITLRVDHLPLAELRVAPEVWMDAYDAVKDEVSDALEVAHERIQRFHFAQLPNSFQLYEEQNIVVGQKVTPIAAVGVYVPGGKASYPSSVLMNVVPAKLAGSGRVVLVTPPRAGKWPVPPEVLVAADIAGVDEIYTIGGAQAIAALAYGTETIAPVEMICGPGNVYVTEAKRQVQGRVKIDMLAGPSEVLVVADANAPAAWIAADLLAQAEHDEQAQVSVWCPSAKVLDEVAQEVERQTAVAKRKQIIQPALDQFGLLVQTKDVAEAIEWANRYAPEHLELMVEEPWSWLGQVKNAGAIFLGRWTPEAFGDYLAGPNHVLPTSGTARFASPLSVDDFLKKSSVIYASRSGLEAFETEITTLAEAEGLSCHAQAARIRVQGKD